jgi:hypothetical protein
MATRVEQRRQERHRVAGFLVICPMRRLRNKSGWLCKSSGPLDVRCAEMLRSEKTARILGSGCSVRGIAI